MMILQEPPLLDKCIFPLNNPISPHECIRAEIVRSCLPKPTFTTELSQLAGADAVDGKVGKDLPPLSGRL
jgi:hypothetical protein